MEMGGRNSTDHKVHILTFLFSTDTLITHSTYIIFIMVYGIIMVYRRFPNVTSVYLSTLHLITHIFKYLNIELI